MAEIWDLSQKKWVYWTGFIGFILNFQIYLWLIAVILYFAADRDKPKTQNYQIQRVFEKYMIVVGNLSLAISILFLIVATIVLLFSGLNLFELVFSR